MTFQEQLKGLLNVYSAENGSDTPDWILAEYLKNCLMAFDQAVIHREQSYGRRTAEKNCGQAY